tara:strand:- start:5 stop:700 length:696 start_codon:yes stop_codon:yes gene_type:complete
MFKNEKIIIFVAHPDDEVLGCGGLIAKYSSDNKFKVVFIAEGETCRMKKNETIKQYKKKITERNNQSKKALRLLGVQNFNFYNFKCGELHNIPMLKINKLIEKEITLFKPTIILTHSENDLNLDHCTISKSVKVSTRPVKNITKNLKLILNFEILSSSEWNISKVFKPNFFIELTKKDLEKKIKALEIYKNEIRPKPHSRSNYGIEILSRYRGLQIGKEFSEAYKVNKFIC